MIPEPRVDVFERESVAHLATVLPDDTQRVTSARVDREDREHVLAGAARGEAEPTEPGATEHIDARGETRPRQTASRPHPRPRPQSHSGTAPDRVRAPSPTASSTVLSVGRAVRTT